jgi:predicted RNA binding protein YcfA (HicA-like mRNA interferase family)
MADSVEKNLHMLGFPDVCYRQSHATMNVNACKNDFHTPFISDSDCAGHQQWIRVSNQQDEQESTSLMADSVENNLHMLGFPDVCYSQSHATMNVNACKNDSHTPFISDSDCAGHQQWIKVSNQQR